VSDALALPSAVDEPLVVHGDALETMRRLPDGCVNLIATDPPYFRVKGEAWDRQWDSAAGFLAWIGELADEWRRVLAPNGSLYVFASPQMAARVECVIAERFAVLNSITWAKPPFSTKAEMFDKATCRSYFPATERIVFAEQQGADSMAMGESGYEAQCERLRGFVFEPLRAYICGEFDRAGMLTTGGKIAANVACGFSASSGGMASRHYFSASQWQLPTAEHYAALRGLLGPGYLQVEYEALREQYEALREQYEALREQYEALREQYEALRRPFAVSADVPYTDVWTFPTVQSYPGKHPCEKPRAMMDHIVAASSRPGDVVLDCFLGSGVTGEAAVGLGRRFIGVEMGEYVHGARRRIAAAVGTPEAAARVNAVAPAGAQLGMF
jgi:adenine-specific DNA-methyltransferase